MTKRAVKVILSDFLCFLRSFLRSMAGLEGFGVCGSTILGALTFLFLVFCSFSLMTSRMIFLALLFRPMEIFICSKMIY